MNRQNKRARDSPLTFAGVQMTKSAKRLNKLIRVADKAILRKVMSNTTYEQLMLPGLDTRILPCSCKSWQYDSKLGKHMRPHKWAKIPYSRSKKHYWICTNCGLPYWNAIDKK